MLIYKSCRMLICYMLFIFYIFGFWVTNAYSYPIFAQQAYSNPRAANGKLACANCHLNQKSIEIDTPQAVLPNSIFEVQIKVPYDTNNKQLDATGKKIDLNVGGIVILPKGFKLAPKKQLSETLKQKTKGIYISSYSTEQENILVVGPIAGKSHQELTFPILAPNPETNPENNYLTYPIYAGGNRGRGQVYPTGEKSNINIFGANATGKISEITETTKGDYQIFIDTLDGNRINQTLTAGLELTVKPGDFISIDQPLNKDPNVGGFGQEETEIVLQNPLRIIGYLLFSFFLLLTQIFLILKKKQFEKVQAAELNF